MEWFALSWAALFVITGLGAWQLAVGLKKQERAKRNFGLLLLVPGALVIFGTISVYLTVLLTGDLM